MEFKKYSSIENGYRKKFTDMVKIEFGQETYFIQEKVHGSNFSIWFDGYDIKCAKRTAFLLKGERFLGVDWEAIQTHYEPILRSVQQKLICQEVVLFGELYGGTYPHKDVPRKPTASKIQGRIYYTPNDEFIVFDIKVDGRVLGYTDFQKICSDFGIPYLPALSIGTLDQCMAYPVEFESTVYNIHGLPKIEDNIAEGYVVKTVFPKYFGNGQRVVIKNKGDKWTEKNKSKKKSDKMLKEPAEPLSAEAMELSELMTLLVNENRLRNVLSKISGEITCKSFGTLMKDMNIDILEEFNKDSEEDFKALDKKEQKRITGVMNEMVKTMIRRNLANIIDEEF